MNKKLLVTEVGTVLVVLAEVSIIGGRGTEEDGGRQVIPAVFYLLVHMAGHARLNGHSVTWKVNSTAWVYQGITITEGLSVSFISTVYKCEDVWDALVAPHVEMTRVEKNNTPLWNNKYCCLKCKNTSTSTYHPLTYFKVLDCRPDLHHPSWRLVPQNHWLCEHKVPDSAMLPVVNVWATDSNRVHLEQNLWVQNMDRQYLLMTGECISSPCSRKHATHQSDSRFHNHFLHL